MNINDFIEAVLLGREIEFSFSGNNYFLQTDYSTTDVDELSKEQYNLYLCPNHQKAIRICHGSINDILNYNFGSNKCLQQNFELFKVSCIL